MINIKKCQVYNRNTGGSLKRSIEIEISKHKDLNSVCSGDIFEFMVEHGLGEKPIVTMELIQLLQAL